MHEYKIIFTGPSGAGKTTAISALSDIPPVRTDERASEDGVTRYAKNGITVALDYGLIKLHDNDKIHLYGTPGQERFNFMWEILQEGGLGLILLVDNARPEPFRDMEFFLDAFKDFIHKTQLAVGITRMDLNPRPDIPAYRDKLKALGFSPPVFEVDARVKRDVSLLLQALLYSLDPCLES
jgi:signal recognition particle receptor subunit beta